MFIHGDKVIVLQGHYSGADLEAVYIRKSWEDNDLHIVNLECIEMAFTTERLVKKDEYDSINREEYFKTHRRHYLK